MVRGFKADVDVVWVSDADAAGLRLGFGYTYQLLINLHIAPPVVYGRTCQNLTSISIGGRFHL